MSIVRTAPAAQSGSGTSLYLWCPGCEDLHQVHFGGTAGNQWEFDGDTERPTLSPSLLVRAVQWSEEYALPKFDKRRDRHPNIPPGEHTICHSFVRDGTWQFLSDSTHVLAGRTVPCVPIPDGLFES